MNYEIRTFNSGELTPKEDAVSNIEKYAGGCRHLENFIPRVYGSAERRPGTRFVESAYTANLIANYKMTYFSENGTVWGVPMAEGIPLTLDVGESARNIGGGLVGLPCTGHPFKVGQVIQISGTTQYTATTYTLHATTSDNELVITATYAAETFTDTSRVVQTIQNLGASVGRMVQDSHGNLYVSHLTTNGTQLTKIEADGTIVNDFFTPATAWPNSAVFGLSISDDERYIYMYIQSGLEQMRKFSLVDGSEIWMIGGVVPSLPVFWDMDIDSDDNVYMAINTNVGGTDYRLKLYKYNSDGVELSVFVSDTFKDINQVYHIEVNEVLGKIITGKASRASTSWGEAGGQCNIAICDLDGSNYKTAAIGSSYIDGAFTSYPTIGKGGIAVYGGYIYAVAFSSSDSYLYKLDTGLNVLASVAIDYAIQIFVDLWGNIVVIKKKSSTPYNTDAFIVYDADLNFVRTNDNYYVNMLSTLPTYTYIGSNVCFWPGLYLQE